MITPSTPIRDERLKEVARHFRYPPTPDVAGGVLERIENGSRPRARLQSAWVVTGLLVLALVVLFAVPGVRAEIVRFLRVGVVRIFPVGATQTAIPEPPQIPLTATPMGLAPNTLPPQSTNTPFTSPPGPLYDITKAGLAGETTLEAASASVPFLIRLPAYPANLGAPERVFLQEDGGMVILVWTNPANPRKVLLSLYEIGPGSVIIGKFEPRVIQETQVNGKYAVWVQGPYLVELTNDTYNWRRLVEGNTLIWEVEGITYRLESDLTLEETVTIAEFTRITDKLNWEPLGLDQCTLCGGQNVYN